MNTRELSLQEKTEKVTIIQKRIIREVTQYYAEHKDGFPMQMLAAKYARSIQVMGIGFPEFVAIMSDKGLLQVRFLEHGAREVYPRDVTIDNVSTIELEWF